MPSAQGSIRVLLVGAIVAVCSLMAYGDDGGAPPAGNGPETRPAPRDGAVQQALRNLYTVPKASNGAATGAATSGWRDAGSAASTGHNGVANNEMGTPAKPAGRWSPNLATRYRLAQKAFALTARYDAAIAGYLQATALAAERGIYSIRNGG